VRKAKADPGAAPWWFRRASPALQQFWNSDRGAPEPIPREHSELSVQIRREDASQRRPYPLNPVATT
jgi:hypothetical protein